MPLALRLHQMIYNLKFSVVRHGDVPGVCRAVRLYDRVFRRAFVALMAWIARCAFRDSRPYDVILVFPKSDQDRIILYPQSLLTVAAPLVKSGLRVKILDQRIERYCEDNLARLLRHPVLCVGFTFFSGSQIRNALKLMALVKRIRPETPTVAGGPHASVSPAETLAHPLVDFVVVGEGEKSFFALVEALKNRQNPAHLPGAEHTLDGILLKSQGVSLEARGETPYSLIASYRHVFDSPSVLTSRGCPHHCGFCVVPVVSSGVRLLSPETVVTAVKKLLAFQSGRPVYFLDDNFLMNPERVRRIFDLLEGEGRSFNWWAMARIDDLLNLDEEFLAYLVERGFSRVFLGAESGSDRILKLIGKKIPARAIEDINRRLSRYPVVPEFSFMYGFPGETPEEKRDTLALITRLKRDNPKAAVWEMNRYTPYPGTPLHDLAVEMGFREPRSLAEWAAATWYGSGGCPLAFSRLQ